MKFSGRKIVTFAVSSFAGIAAGTLTSMALKQNTEAVKVSEKVARVVGGIVIGSMVQDHAEKYIEKYCDQIFDFFEDTKEEIKKMNAETEAVNEESE